MLELTTDFISLLKLLRQNANCSMLSLEVTEGVDYYTYSLSHTIDVFMEYLPNLSPYWCEHPAVSTNQLADTNETNK